jgi:hypothetical protein
MNSRIFIALIALFLVNCSSNSDYSSNYNGLWKIKSRIPEIVSNPNQPDCRLLNDQIFISEFGTLSWTYPLPDSNGSYFQPCQSGSNSEFYDYKKINNELKIYSTNTTTEINWNFQLNGNLLTVSRPNSTTVYEKNNN